MASLLPAVDSSAENLCYQEIVCVALPSSKLIKKFLHRHLLHHRRRHPLQAYHPYRLQSHSNPLRRFQVLASLQTLLGVADSQI